MDPPKVSPKPLGSDLGSQMTILGPDVTLDDPGGWYQVIESLCVHYCSQTVHEESERWKRTRKNRV